MSEWKTYQLGSLARFQRGVTWSKDQETAEPDSSCVPVLRIPNIQDQLDTSNLIWLKGVRKESIKQCAAAKDWVLMVGSNGNPDRVGNCVLITEENEFLFASFLVGIEPTHKTQLCPAYMFRLLRGPEIQRYISDDVQGSTGLSNINLSRLKAKVVEIPSANEQNRIATILTTLDEVIEATEKLVEKHQQIKAGMMHDLFTRGLWTREELARGDHKGLPCEATAKEGQLRPTPEDAPKLYKDTQLGLIPKVWKAELLDVLAKRGSGHTPNRHTPTFWDGGIKWVSLADSSNLDQLYISETEKEISLLGINNSSAVLHPPGIVVLSRDAGVGKSAITTCQMAVSQHFMCWLCGPKLDNHYLYYWLQDQKRVFENISTGTTIPTIGLGFFRRYKIAVPSNMDEQQKIRASLLSSDATLFALEDDLAKLRQQKQGLMHDLLTGRVRV